ncbi:MAG: hypothetical protein AB7S38_15390 [Vulcanimicrobiota bacterium]
MALPPITPQPLSPYPPRMFPLGAQSPDFTLPDDPPTLSQRFEGATRDFGESIQALSPEHRREIQVLHQAVDQWADGQPGADRLGTFVWRVMEYSHHQLERIEDNPATAQPGECEGLEKVFLNGYHLVEVYSSLR